MSARPITDETGQIGGLGETLAAEALSLGYDERAVVSNLSVAIPPGRITVIVGANACGKSTLLRGLAPLIKPQAGAVVLDGQDIHRLPTKQVATRLGILPQSPAAPEGITVVDLIARGRYPHQGWMRQWTREDDAAVSEAMRMTGTTGLAARPIDELSGGQRQRAWIAMALAQETAILLLDEPTTFLDLAHQMDVLDLLVDLNRERGRTIVLVLHDLNQASRYCHHLIAMQSGSIVAEGPPSDVVTESLVNEVFGLEARVVNDPVAGTPMVVPVGRHFSAAPNGSPESTGTSGSRSFSESGGPSGSSGSRSSRESGEASGSSGSKEISGSRSSRNSSSSSSSSGSSSSRASGSSAGNEASTSASGQGDGGHELDEINDDLDVEIGISTATSAREPRS